MAAYKDGVNTAAAKFKAFVPKIWTARLLANLSGKTVLKQYNTTEYQGEISGFGDTVSVPSVGRITVADYLANGNNTAVLNYASNDGGELLITVDSAKAWSTKVEDIEKAQSKPEFVNELMKEAAFALAKNTENYLYNKMVTSAEYDTADAMGQKGGSSATNGGLILMSATGVAQTSALLYTNWLQISERLTDLGAPEDGRFIVVPSFVKSLLLNNDRFVGAAAEGSGAARGKGYIGDFDGLAVHVMPRGYFARTQTTNFDKGYIDLDTVTSTAVADLNTGSSGSLADDYKMLAGVQGAHAYVEQLSKTETIRLEGAFANGIRGLHVYGSGVLRPQWLVTAAVDDFRSGTDTGTAES